MQQFQPIFDILDSRTPRQQTVVLEYDADLAAEPFEFRERIVAVDQDGSCRWRQQAGQQAEHGGFSAAGLAQHGNHFALADREAQVVDGRETALAFAQLAEDLADRKSTRLNSSP